MACSQVEPIFTSTLLTGLIVPAICKEKCHSDAPSLLIRYILESSDSGHATISLINVKQNRTTLAVVMVSLPARIGLTSQTWISLYDQARHPSQHCKALVTYRVRCRDTVRFQTKTRVHLAIVTGLMTFAFASSCPRVKFCPRVKLLQQKLTRGH